MNTQDQIAAVVKRALDNGSQYFTVGNSRYEIVRNDKSGWHIRTLFPNEKTKA